MQTGIVPTRQDSPIALQQISEGRKAIQAGGCRVMECNSTMLDDEGLVAMCVLSITLMRMKQDSSALSRAVRYILYKTPNGAPHILQSFGHVI